MGKHNRLSRDQKRKAKLARDASRQRQHVSLAYTGNKYKTDELVPLLFSTESGIYESFIMTDRNLTDRHVESALETLVLELRRGPLPPFEEKDAEYIEGKEDELLIWNIRRNWQLMFQSEAPRPTLDQLAGVLRTILGSVGVWTSPSPTARGYLHYIEGFMKKAGVKAELLPAAGSKGPREPEDDPLWVLGEVWCQGDDPTAATDFRDLAEKMIRTGQAQQVSEICQGLMSEARSPQVLGGLSALALQAHQKIRPGIE